MKYKMMIIVRMDLKMTKGKLAVQVAHAAVDCTLKAMKYQEKMFKEWHISGQKKVVVKVGSDKEVYELVEIGKGHDLSTAIIKDAGLTELPPGTLTCGAIGPAPSEIIDKITGNLSLL